LLHVEVWRIENSIFCRPGGKLLTSGLTALNLLKGEGEVNVGVLCSTKRQHADVFVGMLAHVVKGGLVQF
jgi:hypothetical protein